MKKINVRIAKIHPDAKVPAFQSAGAACFDLHVVLAPGEANVLIPPGDVRTFHTGLKFEVPEGWRLDVWSRSGLWFKHRCRVGQSCGKIDSDYRGELLISIENAGTTPYEVSHGERIAQGEFNEVTQAEFTVVDESMLSVTERGESGFGSSGKK